MGHRPGGECAKDGATADSGVKGASAWPVMHPGPRPMPTYLRLFQQDDVDRERFGAEDEGIQFGARLSQGPSLTSVRHHGRENPQKATYRCCYAITRNRRL